MNTTTENKNLFDIISNAPDISDNDKYYWGYQYRLAKEVIVPYLSKTGYFRQGMSVAEIGCAEGGVLSAFVEEGASNALGTDIVQVRLDKAVDYSSRANLNIEYTNHDIVYSEPLDKWKQKFDLVLLRDVIEHLDYTDIALRNIRKIIKPGGCLYVTFPPYYSPFGGHQHTVANTGGKLPYIHLLPDAIFHKLIASGRPNDIEEVKRLQTIKLTPKKFEFAAAKEGLQVALRDFFLLRPVYKMKFGIPSFRITRVSSLPLVKNFLSLEASYLLRV
jgi:SAM-dependent methyltransferase